MKITFNKAFQSLDFLGTSFDMAKVSGILSHPITVLLLKGSQKTLGRLNLKLPPPSLPDPHTATALKSSHTTQAPIQNFNTNQPCIHSTAERLHPRVPGIPKKCWMQHALNCREDTPPSDTIKGLHNIVIDPVYIYIPLWKPPGFQDTKSGFKEFSSSSHTSLLGFTESQLWN